MKQDVEITVNGQALRVAMGTTVAVALLQAGAINRTSVSGEPRQPFCGMGVCYECRAEIDGELHQRTCQILCAPGMRVAAE